MRFLYSREVVFVVTPLDGLNTQSPSNHVAGLRIVGSTEGDNKSDNSIISSHYWSHNYIVHMWEITTILRPNLKYSVIQSVCILQFPTNQETAVAGKVNNQPNTLFGAPLKGLCPAKYNYGQTLANKLSVVWAVMVSTVISEHHHPNQSSIIDNFHIGRALEDTHKIVRYQ